MNRREFLKNLAATGVVVALPFGILDEPEKVFIDDGTGYKPKVLTGKDVKMFIDGQEIKIAGPIQYTVNIPEPKIHFKGEQIQLTEGES